MQHGVKTIVQTKSMYYPDGSSEFIHQDSNDKKKQPVGGYATSRLFDFIYVPDISLRSICNGKFLFLHLQEQRCGEAPAQ